MNKLATFFYIALGIHKGDGIVWNSIDKEPVKIIFLIIGPSSKPKEYLQILSKITTIFLMLVKQASSLTMRQESILIFNHFS